MKFNCLQCGKELEVLDCDRPQEKSAKSYCMVCFKEKRITGVKVKFKDEKRSSIILDKVTNQDYSDGFVHLSVVIKPPVYNTEHQLVERAVLDTIASFNTDMVFSIMSI